MGKSTIKSMAIFNSFLYVYQRVINKNRGFAAGILQRAQFGIVSTRRWQQSPISGIVLDKLSRAHVAMSLEMMLNWGNIVEIPHQKWTFVMNFSTMCISHVNWWPLRPAHHFTGGNLYSVEWLGTMGFVRSKNCLQGPLFSLSQKMPKY